jgi:hypothetical protein
MLIPSCESRVFNSGSDARLAGKPETANPYPSDTPMRIYWFRGWFHVDTFWGCDREKIRLQPVALPPIQFEQVACA